MLEQRPFITTLVAYYGKKAFVGGDATPEKYEETEFRRFERRPFVWVTSCWICCSFFCIFVLIYSVMWFTFFVYTWFGLNPYDWFIFCHVMLLYSWYKSSCNFLDPPTTNSRRRALKRRNSPYISQVVASLPTKACSFD